MTALSGGARSAILGAHVVASRLGRAGLELAIVHPLNSAGRFEGDGPAPERPFVVRGSYLKTRRVVDDVEQNGLPMRFAGEHRPLETYARALEDTGFLIEALREATDPDPASKWSRIPPFLDMRAVRR